MSAAPVVPGRLYGLRTWQVAMEDGRPRLVGPYQGTPWPAGGEPVQAECTHGESHAPPAPGCQCGVHGLHPRKRSARRVLAGRFEIPGVVEAWGDVQVHEDGFRAARGRPHALVLQPGRHERLIRELAREYAVDVLELRRPDDLLGHCRRHGLGLEESVVDRLLGPDEAARLHRARRHKARTDVVRVAVALLIAVVMCAAGMLLIHDPHGTRVLHGRAGTVVVHN